MPNQPLQSLWVGLKRRWWGGLRNAFGVVGVTWTVTEVLTRAAEPADKFLDAHGTDYLWLMASLFVAVFVGYIYEPRKVSFKVPTSHTQITLKYSDLFAQEADLLIGVNEFFDGELGQPVKPTSVHGQFISRNYQGNAAVFRAAVDPALVAVGAVPTGKVRAAAPTTAYPIGTTPRVPNGPHSAFLMAMARTNPADFKAASDVSTLWTALQGGLHAVHAHGNGRPLAMPLFGNGQAGINLKPQHLLRLLTLALVDFGRNSNTQLPKEVTVVLHHDCFEELDIREIARDWKRG